MLRRCCIASPLTSHSSALSRSCGVRGLVPSVVGCFSSISLTYGRFQSSSNSGSGSNSTSDSDKAELDRERQLRNRFEQLKSASKQGGFSGMMQTWRQQMEDMRRQTNEERNRAGGGGRPDWSNFRGANGGPMTGGGILTLFYTAFMYTTAMYAVMLVWQTSNDESAVGSLQGIPWYASRAETTGVAILTRAVLPVATQRDLKNQLESHSRVYPWEGVDQYVMRYRPDLIMGHQYQAPEVIAVVAQAIRGAGIEATKTIISSTQSAKRGDTKAAIDSVVNHLRSKYPQYCGAPMIPVTR